MEGEIWDKVIQAYFIMKTDKTITTNKYMNTNC